MSEFEGGGFVHGRYATLPEYSGIAYIANKAIVIGSNLLFSADLSIALSNMGFLSPDSCCFSFDKRANGYARGEGAGVVILKRVEEAVRDGDTIRSVIRSTGSSQDGFTPGGLAQPSREAQSRLILDTYQKAGLDLADTRFFEAHGMLVNC